jgi:hypothetical protein
LVADVGKKKGKSRREDKTKKKMGGHGPLGTKGAIGEGRI